MVAGLGGFDPVGAMGAFTGVPLGQVGAGNHAVRLWRQLPWTEQMALESLRAEAVRLVGRDSVRP